MAIKPRRPPHSDNGGHKQSTSNTAAQPTTPSQQALTNARLLPFQFRVNWTLNPATGEYYTNVPSPTKIPSDPPLASYGVEQAKQLAEKVVTLDPPVAAVYSSPFYRCLETLKPTLAKLGEDVPLRGDNGLG